MCESLTLSHSLFYLIIILPKYANPCLTHSLTLPSAKDVTSERSSNLGELVFVLPGDNERGEDVAENVLRRHQDGSKVLVQGDPRHLQQRQQWQQQYKHQQHNYNNKTTYIIYHIIQQRYTFQQNIINEKNKFAAKLAARLLFHMKSHFKNKIYPWQYFRTLINTVWRNLISKQDLLCNMKRSLFYTSIASWEGKFFLSHR